MRPITRNAFTVADDVVIAVAWQDPESLHTVELGTLESWVSYSRFRRNARVAVRFIDAHTGVQYEGSDADVFGFTWVGEDGEQHLTYRYETEPSWAKCPGRLILHRDGTISGCTKEDAQEGCRGTEAIHSGPPTWLVNG